MLSSKCIIFQCVSISCTLWVRLVRSSLSYPTRWSLLFAFGFQHPGNREILYSKCTRCDYACSRASSLRKHLKTHTGEKSFKCNKCDYASVLAGNLRRHLKTHSEEILFYATNATSQLFTQTNWENIWKLTLEKSHSNATNVTMHLFWQAIWEDIW